MADTLSIEEMNRTRAALGMPLLPVPNNEGTSNLNFKKSSKNEESDEDEEEDDPGSTLESRQAAAGDNWAKLQAEADEKKKREAKKLQIRKERDAAQRNKKLEGKGLGEADDDMDTRSWLLSQNKRQKKIQKERTRRLQRELEERENQAQYTERDLAGQRVAHELGDFDEEGEHILTLKDANVENEEDDELENADLRDKEKVEERQKVKMKKPVYDPTDEEGTTGILSHYDEEIEGKKKKRFTLDGKGRTKEEALAAGNGEVSQPQRQKISLDFFEEETKPVSDYVDISEIKVKKPKKKKEKSKRRKVEDDDIFPTADVAAPRDDAPNAMEVDGETQTNGHIKRKREDVTIADDDDLQSNLASQRMAALKKRKRARPEDIARQMREEAAEEDDPMDTGAGNEEGGLVIDETSEFVSNLQKPQPEEERKKRRATSSQPPGAAQSMSPDADGDLAMKQADSDSEPEANSRIKRSASAMSPVASTLEETEANTTTGLADEDRLNSTGIGSTFNMLSSRGLVASQQGAQLDNDRSHHSTFMHHKERLEKEFEKRAIERRRRDRESGLFDRMSRKQQEEYAQQENQKREQYISRNLGDLFNKEYKPVVDLKYVDEHGRHMDQREAFKQMSHQFHGKGPGKMKTEKRLKKIEEEKKRESESSLDARKRGGMDEARGEMGRRNKLAGVRLQ